MLILSMVHLLFFKRYAMLLFEFSVYAGVLESDFSDDVLASFEGLGGTRGEHNTDGRWTDDHK